jgi:hypothetical protein
VDIVDTVLTEGMGLEIATGLAVYLQRFHEISSGLIAPAF